LTVLTGVQTGSLNTSEDCQGFATKVDQSIGTNLFQAQSCCANSQTLGTLNTNNIGTNLEIQNPIAISQTDDIGTAGLARISPEVRILKQK
jgi:hypothetical protein